MLHESHRVLVIAVTVSAALTRFATPASAESLTIKGSETGQNFRLAACPSGQVLVGVAAKTGLYVDSVAPLCSAVTSTGQWTGPVSQGAAIGGSGGSIKVSQCNANDAVVGMSGKIGNWIDGLTIRCRKLTSKTTVSSTSNLYALFAGGATTGTIAALRTCSSHRPVVALSGRYSGFLHELTMTCSS